RIAAVLPLPKKRGAITPKGFTRRYGNTIAARIGVVGRDGLDACVYRGTAVPVNKAPPAVKRAPRPLPGEEYESAKPLPPVENVVEELPPIEAEPSNLPQVEPGPLENTTQPPQPPAESAPEPANQL
ncbi:MAG TPA: hypothetical protein VFU87_06765, partial [Sphingomicrobium sp.]|nr:hypothetical protein [Sphingomicrobium sp.]